MKKPAVPLLVTDFSQQAVEISMTNGMPGFRVQYHRGPVWGRTKEQLRRIVVDGPNPVTGRPVMREIVEKMTQPLTAEEMKTGELKRDRGPATFTGTPDELQQLFLENRWTDFLPVVLPTEEKVAEMLKGTSHDPDTVLGRMHPGAGDFESWTYTVRDAAVNAVMAGAKPEYFPVILALGSTGTTALNVSDNGFASGAVINGPIRQEIGLNYEIGAMGPYAHANSTIGRAWMLLSINGGNSAKVGHTYMGVVGNPITPITMIIAENEEQSPFAPLATRRGFRKGDNVVTLLNGWGVLSAKNWFATVWDDDMDYPQIIKDIYYQQDRMFGTLAVLSPPIANFVSERFDTVDALSAWVMDPPPGVKASTGHRGGMPGGQFNVIVTGGTNNNYFSMGGMVVGRSVNIDDWR